MRPPSRHKDPPMNTGLDFPTEDFAHPFVVEDSDSDCGFEIGI